MLCKNGTNFFIAFATFFFMLEANYFQSFTVMRSVRLNVANFNTTIESYPIVFVAFLSHDDNSMAFLKDSSYGLRFMNRFYQNKKAFFGVVDCTEDEYICESYNIEHYPTLKVIVCERESDTFLEQLTMENINSFIDKYSSENPDDNLVVAGSGDHDLVRAGSGDDDWDDSKKATCGANYKAVTINQLFVRPITYETLYENSSPEFSFNDDVTEELNSGEVSTENYGDSSNANVNRATDLIAFLLLLYYIHV